MKFDDKDKEEEDKPEPINLLGDKEEDQGIDKQKRKSYAEKVKGYTKYETSRKISKNIEPFTKK